jgi:hypothetical protein
MIQSFDWLFNCARYPSDYIFPLRGLALNDFEIVPYLFNLVIGQKQTCLEAIILGNDATASSVSGLRLTH